MEDVSSYSNFIVTVLQNLKKTVRGKSMKRLLDQVFYRSISSCNLARIVGKISFVGFETYGSMLRGSNFTRTVIKYKQLYTSATERNAEGEENDLKKDFSCDVGLTLLGERFLEESLAEYYDCLMN